MQIILWMWMFDRCLPSGAGHSLCELRVNMQTVSNRVCKMWVCVWAHTPLWIESADIWVFQRSLRPVWCHSNRGTAPLWRIYSRSRRAPLKPNHVWLYGISSVWSRRDFGLVHHIQLVLHAAGAGPGFGSLLSRADRVGLAGAPVLAG